MFAFLHGIEVLDGDNGRLIRASRPRVNGVIGSDTNWVTLATTFAADAAVGGVSGAFSATTWASGSTTFAADAAVGGSDGAFNETVWVTLATTFAADAAVAVAPPEPSVLTFATSSIVYVPNPNIDSNTRPLQLNPSGGAMNTGATPNQRNFIYKDLTCDDASVIWVPSGQSLSAAVNFANNSAGLSNASQRAQRFDYYFNTSTSSQAGPPVGYTWTNRFDLYFGAFYLDGPYSFCGAANVVNLVSATSTGVAQFTGGDGAWLNRNSLSSSAYNIAFGASGKTGTLQFTAATDVQGTGNQISGGIITITINN